MVSKKYQRKKESREDIIAIFLILVLNVAVICMLLVGNMRLYSRSADLKKKFIDLGKELSLLESKNQELENLFMQASQKDHLEKIIREKGLYKKPGEEVVVIVPPPKPQEPLGAESQRENVLNQIIEYFRTLLK